VRAGTQKQLIAANASQIQARSKLVGGGAVKIDHYGNDHQRGTREPEP
jgi:hypothetical protein